ncbi:MAG: histidinol-phosphate transaminase [Bifidobacteriaceae bacterium]|jgi:histidinol-phosphate aminotransferase|nr:histidinol-phosphate transaminase [Bifidobacteriaceae bacterium]
MRRPPRLPVRPDIAQAQPYGAPHPDVPVRLNVNENPYPPPPEVVESVVRRVRQAAERGNRYPDRDFAELRSALADYLVREAGVPELTSEMIWAANGSNEVITHIFQAFGGPGRTAVSFDPSYSMYPEYARNTSTAWQPGTREADFRLDPAHAIAHIDRVKPTVVLLDSPNNPTGALTPLADIEAIAQQLEGQAVLVVDEAYAEFRSLGAPSALTLVAEHPHVAVARTMSKAFAFAGVRLGYLAAQPELIGYLRTVRLPYHLSALTQAAALAALDHAGLMLGQVADLRERRERLSSALVAMGFQVADSQANFVLFGRLASRRDVFEKLLAQGVIVREVGPPGWLRVSVGTEVETLAFLRALAQIREELE